MDPMNATAIVRPALVLAGWTVVMLLWMLATRIPALTRANVDAQAAQDTSRIRDLVPPEVQRVANNYNHLFEQPTLFYAVVLLIAVAGQVDDLHVTCAWAFTIIRIVHSCVQATVDIVMVRLPLFLLAWIALGTMIVRALLASF